MYRKGRNSMRRRRRFGRKRRKKLIVASCITLACLAGIGGLSYLAFYRIGSSGRQSSSNYYSVGEIHRNENPMSNEIHSTQADNGATDAFTTSILPDVVAETQSTAEDYQQSEIISEENLQSGSSRQNAVQSEISMSDSEQQGVSALQAMQQSRDIAVMDAFSSEEESAIEYQDDNSVVAVSEAPETSQSPADPQTPTYTNPEDDPTGYILPESNSRYLSDSDIVGLNLKQLNYAKNEIYARRGRLFVSNELQNYFNSKTWYQGTIAPESFLEDMLNEYESTNAAFLSEREKQMAGNDIGYPLDQ